MSSDQDQVRKIDCLSWLQDANSSYDVDVVQLYFFHVPDVDSSSVVTTIASTVGAPTSSSVVVLNAGSSLPTLNNSHALTKN